MPAKDSCHDSIVNALKRTGWSILSESARLAASDLYIQIDIEAENEDRSAHIEVKCFPGRNSTQELYIALGQYLIYREVVAKLRPDSSVYLGVPRNVYETVFTETVRNTITRNHVKMIIVDSDVEAISQWIE